jgi:hypothetical protein
MMYSKKIREYEQGDLDEGKTTRLFQHVTDAEIVWMLREHYGRVAISLIEEGKCHKAYRNA